MTYRDPKTGRWAQARHHRVFVYGTLKHGYGNWHRLLKDNSTFVCHARTVDLFSMLSYGAPVVTPAVSGASGRVRGEVYDVDNTTLQHLNYLEGYRGPGRHNLYDRISVQYTTADGTEAGEALMYVGGSYMRGDAAQYVMPDQDGLLTWTAPQYRANTQGEQVDG